jgi:hypothetical protein
MLISVHDVAGKLEHRCPGCEEVSAMDTDGLVLGDSVAGFVNTDLIRLPSCSCGAVSFLVRTWDETPAQFHGSEHDLQRRAVNALAQELKAKGRSHTDARAIHDTEKAAPPDLAELPLVVRPIGKKRTP